MGNEWNQLTKVAYVCVCVFQGCRPYSIAECEHYMKGSRPPCEKVPTPECVKQCESGYKLSYENDKHFGKFNARCSILCQRDYIAVQFVVRSVTGIFVDLFSDPSTPVIYIKLFAEWTVATPVVSFLA